MKDAIQSLLRQRAMVVAFGKIISSFAGMALPMYLARAMSIEDYGSYKQVLLVWIIGLQILGLGIDHGLFYFIGKDPKKAAIYSLNVLIFNFAITFLVLLGMTPFVEPLANLINNPQMANYWWPLCAVILVSLPGQHFEHLLMLLEKTKANMFLQIITETTKSIIIMGVFYWTKDLSLVLWALALFYGLRSGIHILFNRNLLIKNQQTLSKKEMWHDLVEQFKFGLPLGISKFSMAFMGLDKFIVSSFLGLKNFAFYAVGTMELPFVPGVAYTYIDSMGMDMMVTLGDKKKTHLVWLDALKKVFYILFIPVCFVGFFAEDFILFFYGEKFELAANLLRLNLINFMILGLDFEIVYRVFDQNKRMAKLYLAYVFGTLIMVFIGSWGGNLIYPLIGRILCSFVYIYQILKDFSHLFELKIKDLIPWRYYFKNAAIIVLLGLICFLVRPLLPPLPVFIKLMSLGLFYLGLIWLFIIKNEPGIIKENSPEELMGVAHET